MIKNWKYRLLFVISAILVVGIMKLYFNPAQFRAKEDLPDITKDILLQLANVDQDEQD